MKNKDFLNLSQKEKVTIVKKTLNTVKDTSNQLTKSLQNCFEKLTIAKNNSDLEAYQKNEKELYKLQKSDADFSNLYIKKLNIFNEVNVNDLEIITPEMEERFLSFISEVKDLEGFQEFKKQIEQTTNISVKNIIPKNRNLKPN